MKIVCKALEIVCFRNKYYNNIDSSPRCLNIYIFYVFYLDRSLNIVYIIFVFSDLSCSWTINSGSASATVIIFITNYNVTSPDQIDIYDGMFLQCRNCISKKKNHQNYAMFCTTYELHLEIVALYLVLLWFYCLLYLFLLFCFI